MTNVRWVGYHSGLWASYEAFAHRMFGDSAYQATRGYIQWLYDDNPHSHGSEVDFQLGVGDDGDVVGCIHKMRLPWRVAGATVEVPAIHNLMVTPEHRSGLGLMLLLASFKGEQHALIPGVQGPLADAYGKLGCQKIETQWFRQVLRPAKALTQLAAQRLFSRSAPAIRFPDRFEQREDDLHATTLPDEAAVDRLVQKMAGRGATPNWTPALVTWRFFHSRGPRHLLIENTDGDFVILSVGPRRGVNVGRVIDAHAASAPRLASLLKFGATLLKKHGAVALLTFCADPHTAEQLRQLQWRPMKDAPSSYFFHRQRRDVFDGYTLSGSAGDFGFEALAKEAA